MSTNWISRLRRKVATRRPTASGGHFGEIADLDADQRRIHRELDAIRVHSLG